MHVLFQSSSVHFISFYFVSFKFVSFFSLEHTFNMCVHAKKTKTRACNLFFCGCIVGAAKTGENCLE